MFVITVDDPQKVGDPIRAYTMYTVHTKVCNARLGERARISWLIVDYIAALQQVILLRAPSLLRLPLAV